MRRARILALTILALTPLSSVSAQIVAPKSQAPPAGDPATPPAAQAAPAKVFSAEDIATTMMPGVVLIRCEGRVGGKFGSGFFVKPGVVVTNHHVIKGMMRGTAQLTVSSVDTEPPAWRITEIIAIDEEADLALLAVPGATRAERPSLPLVTTLDKITIGQKVYALGNPEGLTGTISEGIVSANLRKDGNIHFVQLTAPISPGSSGGPVINSRGEVIGVAVGALSEGQNLNFAIAAPAVVPLLEKLDPKRRGPTVLGGDLPDDWRVPAPPAPVATGHIAVQHGDGARRQAAAKPPTPAPPKAGRTGTKSPPPPPPPPAAVASDEGALDDSAEAGYLGYGDTLIVSSLGRLGQFARQRPGARAVLGGLKINAVTSDSSLDVVELKTKVRNSGSSSTSAYFVVVDMQLAGQIREYMKLFAGLPVQLHFRVDYGATPGSSVRCTVYGVTWFDSDGRARSYSGRQ